MPLLLLLLIWFFAEISAFISIGDEIGVGMVILEIIFSAMIGMWIIRKTIAQGMLAMLTMGGGGVIGTVVGSTLLVIPGFMTDALGLLALIPGMLSFVLTVLGLGRKVNMDAFMKNRMSGMGGFSNMGGGNTSASNPFSRGNPFGDDGTNPFVNMGGSTAQPKTKTKSKPLNGDIIDGDVVRKHEQKD